jgi:hypothetical protein
MVLTSVVCRRKQPIYRPERVIHHSPRSSWFVAKPYIAILSSVRLERNQSNCSLRECLKGGFYFHPSDKDPSPWTPERKMPRCGRAFGIRLLQFRCSRSPVSIDSVSKALDVFLVFLYVSGFLITSLHIFKYGFSEMNPLRPKTLRGTLEAPPSRVALLVDPLLLFCGLLRWCLLLHCCFLGCHLLILPF